MNFLAEMMYDFEMKRSRTLFSRNLVIVDNVKNLSLVSEEVIVVNNGKEFTAVSGSSLMIKELDDERMHIKGNISKVEIYANSEK